MGARSDSSSSSSEDEEDVERIKEAVWSFGPETHRARPAGEQHTHSKRLKVCEHEHDGNKLKTTPEFRSHVAKKLGAMLDSVICEVFSETPDCKSAPQENTQDESEGFRLFSTSLPGNWREEPKQAPPPKRRPAPSSSDSDSEMESRLREAAVSISDLLPSSSTETGRGDERTDSRAKDEDSAERKKKKKKKRKAVTEGEEDELLVQRDRAVSQEQSRENNTLKKKKKKVNEGLKEA